MSEKKTLEQLKKEFQNEFDSEEESVPSPSTAQSLDEMRDAYLQEYGAKQSILSTPPPIQDATAQPIRYEAADILFLQSNYARNNDAETARKLADEAVDSLTLEDALTVIPKGTTVVPVAYPGPKLLAQGTIPHVYRFDVELSVTYEWHERVNKLSPSKVQQHEQNRETLLLDTLLERVQEDFQFYKSNAQANNAEFDFYVFKIFAFNPQGWKQEKSMFNRWKDTVSTNKLSASYHACFLKKE